MHHFSSFFVKSWFFAHFFCKIARGQNTSVTIYPSELAWSFFGVTNFCKNFATWFLRTINRDARFSRNHHFYKNRRGAKIIVGHTMVTFSWFHLLQKSLGNDFYKWTRLPAYDLSPREKFTLEVNYLRTSSEKRKLKRLLQNYFTQQFFKNEFKVSRKDLLVNVISWRGTGWPLVEFPCRLFKNFLYSTNVFFGCKTSTAKISAWERRARRIFRSCANICWRSRCRRDPPRLKCTSCILHPRPRAIVGPQSSFH